MSTGFTDDIVFTHTHIISMKECWKECIRKRFLKKRIHGVIKLTHIDTQNPQSAKTVNAFTMMSRKIKVVIYNYQADSPFHVGAVFLIWCLQPLTLTLPGQSAGVSGSLDSYCSLKPLCSGMGEVVPARTSPTLLPPSPRTVL